MGGLALLVNTTGSNNTAVGWDAMRLNTTASANTAVGAFALFNNDTGPRNTAVGSEALFNTNQTAAGNAQRNTAVGIQALRSNTIGSSNNAVGDDALFANTTGSFNQAMGVNALLTNLAGSANVAIGDNAGFNLRGSNNTTVGTGSSANGITTGSNNTTLGFRAGLGITSSSGNIILGLGAGPNTAFVGSDNIYIGNNVTSTAFESGRTRIRDSAGPIAGTNSTVFFGGIFNATVGAINQTVKVNAAGQLGGLVSSARFKTDIESMGKVSESILALRPVAFHYKGDPAKVPCFGLIAEEVAKVNPDLIIKDDEGKPISVRYDEINAMLLNEFLKEHKKVEEQQASITELKSTVAQQAKGMEVLTAQLKEQAAQIQRVSAQLEVSKPAPQVVTNKP